jgi:hypothetical protein
MLKKIIEDATLENLKEFICDTFYELKYKDNEMYEELEMELYKKIYGCHFNEWMLAKALEEMENEDGSLGGHWSLAETTALARQHNISFNNINEYDWCYTMNMIYSDYYGSVSNESTAYIKLAKKFLFDKDSPNGKAFKYYIAMR